MAIITMVANLIYNAHTHTCTGNALHTTPDRTHDDTRYWYQYTTTYTIHTLHTLHTHYTHTTHTLQMFPYQRTPAGCATGRLPPT